MRTKIERKFLMLAVELRQHLASSDGVRGSTNSTWIEADVIWTRWLRCHARTPVFGRFCSTPRHCGGGIGPITFPPAPHRAEARSCLNTASDARHASIATAAIRKRPLSGSFAAMTLGNNKDPTCNCFRRSLPTTSISSWRLPGCRRHPQRDLSTAIDKRHV